MYIHNTHIIYTRICSHFILRFTCCCCCILTYLKYSCVSFSIFCTAFEAAVVVFCCCSFIYSFFSLNCTVQFCVVISSFFSFHFIYCCSFSVFLRFLCRCFCLFVRWNFCIGISMIALNADVFLFRFGLLFVFEIYLLLFFIVVVIFFEYQFGNILGNAYTYTQ